MHTEYHPYKPERVAIFEANFQELTGILDEIAMLLDELINPINLKFSAGTNGENKTEYIPYVLAYSLASVYSNACLLSKNNQHLATAILGRSIVECMANINWLYISVNDKDELDSKINILFNQAEKVYDLTSSKSSYVPSLAKLGAGSIVDRLRAVGTGWPILYSHLSSYAHMDAGYAVHYSLNETLGMRNLAINIASYAVVDSVDKLAQLLPIKKVAKKRILRTNRQLDAKLDEFVNSKATQWERP